MQHPESIEVPSLEERVSHFREMSEQAFRRATAASDKQAQSDFIDLAEQWRMLSIEGEKVLKEQEART